MTEARSVEFFGDCVAFHGPNDYGSGEAWVVGHPVYAHEHDIAVLAPDPPDERQWRVLSVRWLRQFSSGHVREAAAERQRLEPLHRTGFLELR